MGVVITHRIVGPVHKMKRLLRRVSTGRLAIEERLRRGDELEDLFDTFLQMTYSLRAMQAARIKTLDATLRARREDGRLRRGPRGHACPARADGARPRAATLLRDSPLDGRRLTMRKIIATAVDDLCTAFDRHGYNPTPIIDIGVLVASADGKVDEREREMLLDSSRRFSTRRSRPTSSTTS